MATKTEHVDWNEYRKLASFLTTVGYYRQAELVKKLIKVGVACDRGEFNEAAARLCDLPQRNNIIGGP